MNLQNIALQDVLSQIPINKDTSKVLDEYIINYLKTNPLVIEKYLSTNTIYHVYLRGRDTYEYLCERNILEYIQLIKTFTTITSAKEWIIKNGKSFIKNAENDYGGPLVLTIIPFENGCDYDGGETPSQLFMIAGRQYLTYVFSKKGYKMIIDEHQDLLLGKWQSCYVAWWIFIYNKSGDHLGRFSMNDLNQILKNLANTYGWSEKDYIPIHDEMQQFLNNPDCYKQKLYHG